MTTLQRLAELIEARTGLDVESLGKTAFEHAMQRRALHCAKSETAYLEWVERDLGEWTELLEEIIVPETWFFRDSEPFRCLAAFARSSRTSIGTPTPIRVLSAPCSSGEEPYSIAISLLQAGFTLDQIQLEAIDISGRMLVRARAGCYGNNAFRRDGLEYQALYFTPELNGWRLKSPLLGCVDFQQGNLLEAGTLQNRQPYDVIFCRNLLIYLKREAREKLLRELTALLRPAGLLFVGHAEVLQGLSADFKPLPHPRAYAYRRRTHPAGTSFSRHIELPAHTIPKASVSGLMASVAANVAFKSASKIEITPLSVELQIAQVQRWADEGRLLQAREKLTELLTRNSGSAENWCLLGMLNENLAALREAEECYSKALYLDPVCYDALVQLAFLAERRNDVSLSARLRTRAQRALADTGEHV